MLEIDLRGKRVFVAGVADDAGFGFAIAKHLFRAGASICVGTWPPAYGVFTKLLKLGKLDSSRALPEGGRLEFERIYPLDAMYDRLEDVPDDVKSDRRYRAHADFSIDGVVQRLQDDFGHRPVDVLVHSLANAPEVKKPLVETSRRGYLDALGASAYSFVSMAQRFAPHSRPGGSLLCISFMAAQRVIPGYGGGMSSAKAALEADTRVLAYELGQRFGLRVNCISAGPWASRAASATGLIGAMVDYNRRNAPLPEALTADEIGAAAAFLSSPLAAGITATTLYVDKGFHSMGIAADALPKSHRL
ncbi:MAG: enoyl-[acyl-carrier-protein] reductase [Proteobacteria bacterium]|nr:enoyl-[acyl-carrier-protein] reductase [Pseudomonadota bacterium]